MRNEHQIIRAVYAAKEDLQKADDLIRDYIPFIRSEASKCISRLCTEQDDEYSIAISARKHLDWPFYREARCAVLSRQD